MSKTLQPGEKLAAGMAKIGVQKLTVIAMLTGLPLQTLSRIRHNKQGIGEEIAEKLAAVFDLPARYFRSPNPMKRTAA